MSDRPPDRMPFSDAELVALRELAQNVIAGRQVIRALVRFIAWLGVVSGGAAALVYYIIAAWNGWHEGRWSK